MLKHSIRQNFGEGVISRFEQMRLDGWPNTAARLPLHKCYKSIPSDYSVSDNGCAHQMALKKNSVRQGVLMCVSGWKRLPLRLSEK
jgi:hypothetical protein